MRSVDVDRHLADPTLRQALVTPMFDMIAPRYDDFTRAFSFGMDRDWKRELVSMASKVIPRNGTAVDVATGTGDLAFALGAVRPDLRVLGTDVSLEMLGQAGRRANGQAAGKWANGQAGRRADGQAAGRRADGQAGIDSRGLLIAAGDISSLPLPDAAVDAITAGYALRNTPDWRQSLHELARVTRPGGHLFTLDFYLPSFAPWRVAFLGWLAAAGRAVGWWWHGEPMAYGYIAKSIEHFTTVHEFSSAVEAAGFSVNAVQPRLGGGIALHHAVRR